MSFTDSPGRPKKLFEVTADATYEIYGTAATWSGASTASIGIASTVTGVSSTVGGELVSSRRSTTYKCYRTIWNFDVGPIGSGSSIFHWEWADKLSFVLLASSYSAPDDTSYDDVWGYAWDSPSAIGAEYNDFDRASVDTIAAEAGIGYPEQKTFQWNTESSVIDGVFLSRIHAAVTTRNNNIGVGLRSARDVSNTQPLANERTYWCSHAHPVAANRPKIIVYYTEPMVLFMGANF